MLFNSIDFLTFFVVVTVAFFLCPGGWQWVLLLFASCVFYASFVPVYIFILVFTIVVDYSAAIVMESKDRRTRTASLVVSILATCLVLFLFKYFDFFNSSVAHVATLVGWNYSVEMLQLVLPIGLSFHTFQSLSYVIEVYRGDQKPERHIGQFAAYVLFFPQLVAGPIERPQNLLHQFKKSHRFEYERVTDGLKLMAWGMFKKVVIADRLAIIVDQVYSDPSQYQGISLIVATIFFAYQIYCDFSGYTDIAIGAAQVLGFRLSSNFLRPYGARSFSDFWRRWHITLSSWFRDYVYIPLGGSRLSPFRWLCCIFATFLASGLWHGASWTFVLWGCLHAFYVVFGKATSGPRARFVEASGLSRYPFAHHTLQTSCVFALTCLAWVFFRAESVGDAWYIVLNLLSGVGPYLLMVATNLDSVGAGQRLLQPVMIVSREQFCIAVVSIIILEAVHLAQSRRGSVRRIVSCWPVFTRYAAYVSLVLLIINFGVVQRTPFVYFQF